MTSRGSFVSKRKSSASSEKCFQAPSCDGGRSLSANISELQLCSGISLEEVVRLQQLCINCLYPESAALNFVDTPKKQNASLQVFAVIYLTELAVQLCTGTLLVGH